MNIIIPVAGVGTRLRPHTHTIPKVLISTAGKPILGHILDAIVPLKPAKVILIIGYLGDKVKEYVLGNYALPFEFIEQEKREGLGAAVLLGLRKWQSGPVLVILGDTIFEVNLKKSLDSQMNLLGVKEVLDPSRFGIVETNGEFVTNLVEKPENPKSNLAIVGIYYLQQPEKLKAAIQETMDKDIKTKGEYQLTDALQLMIKDGEKMKTFHLEGWFDCGKPETLLATNRHMLNKLGNNLRQKGSIIIPPVYISRDANVTNSIIGPNVSIADNAEVTNSIITETIINEGATVNKSLLTLSLIGDNAVVEGNYRRLNVGDSSEIDFSGKEY